MTFPDHLLCVSSSELTAGSPCEPQCPRVSAGQSLPCPGPCSRAPRRCGLRLRVQALAGGDARSCSVAPRASGRRGVRPVCCGRRPCLRTPAGHQRAPSVPHSPGSPPACSSRTSPSPTKCEYVEAEKFRIWEERRGSESRILKHGYRFLVLLASKGRRLCPLLFNAGVLRAVLKSEV